MGGLPPRVSPLDVAHRVPGAGGNLRVLSHFIEKMPPKPKLAAHFDPGKGGGSENYFGDVDLACGESSIKVQPSPKPSIPNAEWPYMVTVYSCADGAKGEYLCMVDPRIKWND